MEQVTKKTRVSKKTAAKPVEKLANIEDRGPECLEDLQPREEGAKKTRSAPATTLTLAKEFKPRTNKVGEDDKGRFAQIANWDALVKAIQEHGGKITYAEAMQAVEAAAKKGGYLATANVRGFVQGRVRGGHLKVA